MEKKIKNRISVHKVYILSFLIPTLLWLVVLCVLGYEPFGKSTLLISDGLHQYFPFLSQYRERLLEGSSFFYSLGGGMGFDFWELYTYYLSSPLNLLLILFPGDLLGVAANLLIVLKVGLCALGFAWYLKGKEENDKIHESRVILLACAYACSSFLIGYRANLMWIENIALLPVVAASLESLVSKGKWKGYTLSLALALWCNFYMGFMLCIFLVLWFLLQDFKSIRDFFKKGLHFAGASILAAGLCGVVLLPAYLGVSGTGTFDFPDFRTMGAFWEPFAGAAEGGIFAFSNPITVSNTENSANLYCGIFTLLFFLLYFINRKISLRKKVRVVLLLLVFVLSMNIAPLNYIWHGFHRQVGIPNRFVYMLIFVVLLCAYRAWEEMEKYRLRELTAAALLLLALFAALYYLAAGKLAAIQVLPSVILLLAYFFLLIWQRKYVKDRPFIKRILSALIIIELVFTTCISMKRTGLMSVETYFRERGQVLLAAHFIEEQDQGLYRAEIYNSSMKNESFAYNLKSTGIFSSMVNEDMSLAMAQMGYAAYSNQYSLNNGTPVIEKLFGIKHMLLLQEDKNRLSVGYEKVKTFGSGQVTLYEDQEVLPVGYMVRPEAVSWKVDSKNAFKNQMTILNRMTGGNYPVFRPRTLTVSGLEGIELEQITNIDYEYMDAQPDKEEHIFFEVIAQNDEDWYLHEEGYYIEKTNIYRNEEKIAAKDLSNHFYHIGKVKKGDVIRIALKIGEDSPTLETIKMHLYAYDKSELDKAYEKLADEVFEVNSRSDQKITGTIDVKEDGLFFITIPYHPNWSLLVDGDEVPLTVAGTAFMGTELCKGEYQIELKYTPKAFYRGALISTGSLVILLVISVFSKRAQKKKGGKKHEKQARTGSAINENRIPADVFKPGADCLE